MDDSTNVRVIIAGGGTGGHLYPGIALAQEFESRWKSDILFIGTTYGIENKVLPRTHYRFKKIWMRGLQRQLTPGNLIFPLRLLVSIFQCAGTMLSFRPQVVIGTGGYVSGPALMAAMLLRLPTVIQEQNSYPGLVNRLLGKWAKQVHVTYEASLPYFKNRSVLVSGNPVRGEFNKISRSDAAKKFKLHENKITLFVFGGSQGARAINKRVLESIENLLNIVDLQILWATGPNEYEMISKKVKSLDKRAVVLPYIDDMASAYAASDIALCRAGASTLAEITMCGLPAILVPYPFAAAGHQDFNAKAMQQEGAALVIFERDFTTEILVAKVTELVNDEKQRMKISAAARKLGRPTAARDIVAKIAGLINREASNA
jgi:UDP-N-acetylglucosamine--N-acetylmuramyl-(pentapeptide) pyrophosphoryl-undecaprenol N-acetylglucosamine transferase